jgi:hypothetical protein
MSNNNNPTGLTDDFNINITYDIYTETEDIGTTYDTEDIETVPELTISYTFRINSNEHSPQNPRNRSQRSQRSQRTERNVTTSNRYYPYSYSTEDYEDYEEYEEYEETDNRTDNRNYRTHETRSNRNRSSNGSWGDNHPFRSQRVSNNTLSLETLFSNILLGSILRDGLFYSTEDNEIEYNEEDAIENDEDYAGLENLLLERALQESANSYRYSERKDSVIENIDKMIKVFKKSKDASNTTCAICQEDFVDEDIIVQLKCDHCFHKCCIQESSKYNAKCPICREKILVKDTS